MSSSVSEHFLRTALDFYTNPPLSGVLQLEVINIDDLHPLTKLLSEHIEANRKPKDPRVWPGKDPELYLRWAFNKKGLNFVVQANASRNHASVSLMGTF